MCWQWRHAWYYSINIVKLRREGNWAFGGKRHLEIESFRARKVDENEVKGKHELLNCIRDGLKP